MWQQAYVLPISSSGFNEEALVRDCARREVDKEMSSGGRYETVGRSDESAISIGEGIIVVVVDVV